MQDKAGMFRIVDPAVLPVVPVSPDRVKIMLLGIFAGIAGAFGFVLILDNLDDSIKSLDALRGFGVPVLAVIPSIQNPADLAKRRRIDVSVQLHRLLRWASGACRQGTAGSVTNKFLPQTGKKMKTGKRMIRGERSPQIVPKSFHSSSVDQLCNPCSKTLLFTSSYADEGTS
jgi:hypothetical protein